VTDYVTDPGRDALLLRVRFQPLVPDDLRLYLRFDPTVNGNGGGRRRQRRSRQRHGRHLHRPPGAGRDRPGDRHQCHQPGLRPAGPCRPDASTPFTEVSNGFAGTASDGLTSSTATTP
jgi:glucoamylase